MDGLVWSPIIIEVTLTSKKLEQYCVHGKQLCMFAYGVDMQSSGGSLNETKAPYLNGRARTPPAKEPGRYGRPVQDGL